MPNLGRRGDESSGSVDVSPKISGQDLIHEGLHCDDEAANHLLPLVVAF